MVNAFDNQPADASVSDASSSVETILPLARQVLQAEKDAIALAADLLDHRFEQAVQLIAQGQGRVIVSGMGKSGLIAQKMSATFASTGTPSHYLHPTEAMHGDLGRVGRNDLLMVLSYSGQTEDALSLAALVRQDQVPVIAMTGPVETQLGQLADVALAIGDVTEACPHNLAPTASTTAMLALGDALALAVSDVKQFSAEDFHKRHPGGTLGRLMMPLNQVLRFRVGENLPLIEQNQTVEAVLQKASVDARRAGAVLLVDDAGQLTGILTDADLRRLLVAHGAEVLSQPVADVMTAAPKAIQDNALVRDAVQQIRTLRVDELPVVDAEHRPVGMIDVQDLIGLRVIEP